MVRARPSSGASSAIALGILLPAATSMEPTYHAGDLLLAKNIAGTEIEVGAVVAFDIPAEAQERLAW